MTLSALLLTNPLKKPLPEKICKRCNKPFSWRKKWERDWDNVVFCSERCRRTKKTN
ncbi:MAG: hypothetical protein CMD76_02295 [Gammaproteobacteria bacterium]|nr:hypothetical protein [Gammaproteobacteria bacterium]